MYADIQAFRLILLAHLSQSRKLLTLLSPNLAQSILELHGSQMLKWRATPRGDNSGIWLSSSPEQIGNFQPNFAQMAPGRGKSKSAQKKPRSFPTGNTVITTQSNHIDAN